MLVGTDSPVTRRVAIRSAATLAQLHEVLQIAMGWRNYHLHEFEVRGVQYGPADEDKDEEFSAVDERTVTLVDVFDTTDRAMYLYDFGDSWEHELSLASERAPELVEELALCLDGVGACPPEDCGGFLGYRALLEQLRDPSSAGHDEALEWLGGSFDPTQFDRNSANRRLQRVR